MCNLDACQNPSQCVSIAKLLMVCTASAAKPALATQWRNF